MYSCKFILSYVLDYNLLDIICAQEIDFKICPTANLAFQDRNLIISLKLFGDRIMVLSYFAATGPRWFAIIDATIISELYWHILKKNVRTSLHKLNL